MGTDRENDTEKTLLDVVDALTKPDVIVNWIGDEPNRKMVRREDPPLLDQLSTAVTPNIGGTGGGQLPNTRINIAANAFDKRAHIDERLRAMLDDLGARPGKNVTAREMLRTWYILYTAGHQPIGEDRHFQEFINRWATEIRDIIDAPTQIPYREPCPLCKETRAQWWADGMLQEGAALWAILRPEYRDEGSYGMCRACDQVVARADTPLELRYRINVKIEAATPLTQTIAEATAEGLTA